MKKQQGFAVLEAILILIVLAAIGFTGWFVWHSRQNSDNAAVTTPPKSHSTVFSNYRDKKLGFQFSYPASWGKVDISTQDTISGKGYNVEFATPSHSSQYGITINDIHRQSGTMDYLWGNINDYQLSKDKLVLTMVDGSQESDFTIIRSNDEGVLFTGGTFGKLVAGIKKVNYVSGATEASVTVGNDIDQNSPAVQQKVWDVLSSFKPYSNDKGAES